MTLTEFLLARIAEREALAREALAAASIYDQSTVKWHWTVAHSRGSTWHPTPIDPARVLAECEAQRRIVALHESWPVLAETPTEITVDPTDISGMTMRATRQIAWLTTKEYRARFGDEPPTTPILVALAMIDADHPDYQPEWKP